MPIAASLARRTVRLADPGPAEGVEVASVEVAAAARAAASAALDRGETHYTDRPGIAPLRGAVAARLRDRHGLDVDAADVVITCGLTEARFVTIQRLLPAGTGTVVALADPERVAGACVIRDVALLGPDADVAEGAALVYAPAGVPHEVLDPWLERAARRDWPVVHELDRLDGEPLGRPDVAGRTVTVGDLAAPHGAAAWRVGFMAAPKVTVGPLRDFKQALTLCTTNVSQWGVLALIEDEA